MPFVIFIYNIYCVESVLHYSLQRRDVYGAWEQYLGLEHSDNAPKRSYSVNQVTYSNALNLYKFSFFLLMIT